MTRENPSISDDPRNRKKYVFHTTIFRRVFVGTIRVLLRLFSKIETTGLELIPESGAVILASNHLSNYDVFPIQVQISRPLFFMAKSELHKNIIMDFALRELGAFPVYRGHRDLWSIRHAQKVLEHEQVLAMFPEGSRSKGRGLRAGKTGVARLAIQKDCPVIPVAIDGSQRMFKTFPKRTPIRIVIGAPIYPKTDESTLGLTDRIMYTIAAMLPPDLKGVYTTKPIGFDTE